MGMSIDKAIKCLELWLSKGATSLTENRFGYLGYLKGYFHKYDKEAYELAIDTMRKYQKIQTIAKAWNDMNSFDSMVQISEVIEDGDNN